MLNQVRWKKLKYSNIEEALNNLNAQDKGRYFLCTCPECDKSEAFIYKNNLNFIKCNRENYCGERMLLEFQEKDNEILLNNNEKKFNYPDLSSKQIGALEWANKAFNHIQNYFKSNVLDEEYRGLSRTVTRKYIADLQNEKLVSFMYKKLEPLLGKDYSKNKWMCKRNLVFPIKGDDGVVERVLLRSSIDAEIEPKELHLIINPSKDTRDFFVDIPDDSKTMVISESIIDGLSFREIDSDIGIMALTGTNRTKKLIDYIKSNKKYLSDKHILLAMDDDIAGKRATNEIMYAIEKEVIGRSWSNLSNYKIYKDPNEFLNGDREGFINYYRKSIQNINKYMSHNKFER